MAKLYTSLNKSYLQILSLLILLSYIKYSLYLFTIINFNLAKRYDIFG